MGFKYILNYYNCGNDISHITLVYSFCCSFVITSLIFFPTRLRKALFIPPKSPPKEDVHTKCFIQLVL